jgi:hypothetical protein
MNAAKSGTPQGAACVSRAPNVPDGVTNTTTSQHIEIGGLRIHAVIGGDGRTLLPVHGWWQTRYAWRLVMRALAKTFQAQVPSHRRVGSGRRPDGKL